MSVEIKQLEPARAKHVSDKKLTQIWDDSSEYVAEPKLDGWRYLLHLGDELSRPHLTGRRISKETGVFSEKGLCAPCLWPKNHNRKELGYTVLDGEIIPPVGAGFRDLASIMNSDPETAARTIEQLGPPRYVVFDVLFREGEDMRDFCQLDRSHAASGVVRFLQHELITMIPRVSATREAYDSIVGVGGEGLILKRIDAAYGESGGWVKVKRSTTLDVIVTGFTDAKHGITGKYVGQIGAVIVSVYLSDGSLIPVGQVSGMTDEIRLDMTHNKGSWLGVVIEVEAQEFGKDRLRHPRWGRARPDADARTCTYRKMMRDLGREEDVEETTPGQMTLL